MSDPTAILSAALASRYEIQREVGRGTFATIYLARDLRHDREVAIKVLTAEQSSDVGELRFLREIRLLARFQHPNILPLHDSGYVHDLIYYVTPYIPGDALRGRINRERQLPLRDAVCIAQDVAEALHYAHGHGVVHRDVKPENILLSGRHAIVADFGIALVGGSGQIKRLTTSGSRKIGTPAYMSPEQLMGEDHIDGRSDVYSLACVLFETLTGKAPFEGSKGLARRFTEPPPLAAPARQDVPAWLDAVISKALARDPSERFATAGEMARALSGAPEPPSAS